MGVPSVALLQAAEIHPEAILRTNMMRPVNRKLYIPLRLRNAGCLLRAKVGQMVTICPPQSGADSAFELPGATRAPDKTSFSDTEHDQNHHSQLMELTGTASRCRL